MTRRVAPLVGLLVAVLSACNAGSSSPASGSPSPTPPVRTSQASPSSTAPPVSSDPGVSPAEGSLAPPAMTLLWASGSAAAKLGSWTLDGQGSDSPWLPATALPEIEVGSAALTVQFA